MAPRFLSGPEAPINPRQLQEGSPMQAQYESIAPSFQQQMRGATAQKAWAPLIPWLAQRHHIPGVSGWVQTLNTSPMGSPQWLQASQQLSNPGLLRHAKRYAMGIPGVAKYFSDASLRAAPVQMIMGNPRYSQFLALGPGKQITREFAPGTSYGTPGMKMPWDYFSHFTLPRAQQQQRVIGSRWREMMRERAQRPIPERYGSGLDMFQQFLKGDEGIKLKQLISQLLSLFGKG